MMHNRQFLLNQGPSRQESESLSLTTGAARDWWFPPTLLSLGLVAVFALYWHTAASMVVIWTRSETFAHGYLIVPISAWLIWRKRHHLAAVLPVPNFWGLLPLALLSVSWPLAQFLSVQVLQQLIFVAMIPTLVFTLFGWEITKRLLFPLGFLFLAVPMGEDMIPPMMEFTALFIVKGLQLSGVPVYSEGLYFTIPSGSWSVVEGCSGVRYLIASITLGFLYAYLTYHSFWRRVAFVALAALFPIIANGLRGYMIVMIAYVSDNALATGVDHLIYGWVFFGFVMLLLFWLGSFWRESEPDEPKAMALSGDIRTHPRRPMVAAVAAAILVMGLWPARAYVLSPDANRPVAALDLDVPRAITPWHATDEPISDWKPMYQGMDAEVHQVYTRDSESVGVFLEYYGGAQQQGAELVNTRNMLIVQKHPLWSQVWREKTRIRLDGRPQEIIQSKMHSVKRKLLIWHWYWIADTHTENDYIAKLLQAKSWLLGNPPDGAAIIVYTPYDGRLEPARERLQAFVDQMLGSIVESLSQAKPLATSG